MSAVVASFVAAAVHPADSTLEPSTATVQEAPRAQTTEPTLQQQDVAVKNMIASISLAFANYTASNRGTIPNTDAMLEEFKTSYLSDIDLTNPTTNTNYVLLLNPAAPTDLLISYKPSYACSLDDTSAAPVMGRGRQYALSVILPSGKSYCLGS